ncbi:hypothetical protein OQA88_3882 [Cercophora sp. LCS_1]
MTPLHPPNICAKPCKYLDRITEEPTAPTSKRAAKKAEAKAKEEALKAQRAAELAAAANLNLEDDLAAENYGEKRTTTAILSKDAEEVEISSLNESHIGKTVVDVRIQVKKLFPSYLEDRLVAPRNLSRPFGGEAFLAQSPQIYKQFKIAGARERVFSIGSVFRAENSNTPRHVTEFTGMNIEMEITRSYTEVRDVLKAYYRRADEIATVRSVYPSEPLLLPEPGKELGSTFARAQQLLREEGPPEFANVRDDEDTSTPQEKALGEVVCSKYNTDFYVIDELPETARPSCAKVDNAATPVGDGVHVTNAFDFFMRGQEILSGGQRINDPSEVEGADAEGAGIKEYLEVFKSVGVPSHGGGGIGPDRVVAWFFGLLGVHFAASYLGTPKRLPP